MSEDMAALIARQQAEQAAREAQPGRYDGVLIKDIRHQVEVAMMAMATWRAESDVEPVADPEIGLRAASARSPQAAAAFGLLNAGAPVIVLIDAAGEILTQPTHDVDVIASWFEPGGLYADKWPAIPCGERGGYFGLLVYPGEGSDWFRKVATVHRPTTVERLLAAVADRVDALGVPGMTDSWDDEAQPKPDEPRATVHAKLWLCEDVPPQRPVVRAWMGSLRGQAGQRAMTAGRPQEPRQLSAMVWSWPQGQTLPVGRDLRTGVTSLAAIPALGAPLALSGVRFMVRQVPALLSPPPDWLISALRELI